MSEVNDIIFPNEFPHDSMPVVIKSRIRLARNLNGHKFPQYANSAELSAVADLCKSVLVGCKVLKDPKFFTINNLNSGEKFALVESHICSMELAKAESGSCLLVANNNTTVIMINEEDHLRMQIFSPDLDFKRIWMSISEIDDFISSAINIAYDDTYGFLTSCPTNVGTGMRSSVMIHLPGLVISGQIGPVVNAVQKLGFVVRGIYGEGTGSLGSIFQFSNQHTLGLSEVDILSRLHQIIMSVIENEELARKWILKNRCIWLRDTIGRSFGLLKESYSMATQEAINHLSTIRLAIDFGYLPDVHRANIDHLMSIIQPFHIKVSLKPGANDADCNIKRSEILRNYFQQIPKINL